MLSFFVDSLTLGLPPMLAWAALAVAGGRLDRRRGLRILLVSSVVGATAAVTVAVLQQTTNWISRESLGLGLYPLAVGLGVAVVVWLWRPVRPVLPDGELPRWGRPVLAALAAALIVLSLPDLLLSTKGLVTPGASPFTSETVLNLCGYVLGVALAAITVWTLHRAGHGAPPTAQRWASTIAVALLTLVAATGLVRLLLVRGLVELPHAGFIAVAWLVNHQWAATVGLVVAALVPVAAALATGRRTAPTASNPAQGRLQRAVARSRRRFLAVALAGLAASALAVTVGRAVADAKPELSPPEHLEGDDHDLWVELTTLDDGHLHRFAYAAHDGTEVRFIALRKRPDSFVAALDACNICGPAGYYEQGGQVICARCAVAINVTTIGFKGGCNPIPIEYAVAGGRLVVARQVLDANAKVFA